jgi:hypothetical protein
MWLHNAGSASIEKGVLVPSQRKTDTVRDRLNAFAQADQSLQTLLAAFNISQIRVSPRMIGIAYA